MMFNVLSIVAIATIVVAQEADPSKIPVCGYDCFKEAAGKLELNDNAAICESLDSIIGDAATCSARCSWRGFLNIAHAQIHMCNPEYVDDLYVASPNIKADLEKLLADLKQHEDVVMNELKDHQDEVMNELKDHEDVVMLDLEDHEDVVMLELEDHEDDLAGLPHSPRSLAGVYVGALKDGDFAGGEKARRDGPASPALSKKEKAMEGAAATRSAAGLLALAACLLLAL